MFDLFNYLSYSKGKDGREGMVFFQPPGPEIPDRSKNKPSYEHRVLEDYWERQGDLQQCNLRVGWDEEDVGFLQRESSKRRENQLGHA